MNSVTRSTAKGLDDSPSPGDPKSPGLDYLRFKYT